MKRRRTQKCSTNGNATGSDSGSTSTSGRSSTALCPRESHNQAEKRRAERVRNEFNRLQGILAKSGRSTKQDKRSLLANASGYIEELEKELAAYRQSCSIRQIGPPDDPYKSIKTRDGHTVDYRSVFLANGIPQAVATLNGRFIDCNAMFCWLSGYTKEEVCAHSFYSLTPQWELTKCHALMGELLSLCNSPSEFACSKVFQKHCIFKGGIAKVYVSITLVRDEQGSPAHFTCSVLPLIFTSTSPGSLFCIDRDGTNVEVKQQAIEDKNDCVLEFIDTPQQAAVDGRDGTGDNSSLPDPVPNGFDNVSRALSLHGEQESHNAATAPWSLSFDSTPVSPAVSIDDTRTPDTH